MPGRQGSGPLGGGGGRGGGFRGGGGWGGGWRGGGWGWRPRPRYGWGWGGWRPGFWGWGWGIPWFGPRYGMGCGGFGCLVLIGIAVLFFCIFGGLFGRPYAPGNGNGGFNNFNGGSSGNNGGGLGNQPASVQTQTAIDLSELHGALDSRIPQWQSAIGSNEEAHVSADEAGMGNDNNIKDIVYGKCGTAFYVYVVDKGAPYNAGNADSSGYVYTTATSPATCHPAEYIVTDSEDDGGNWYFVYLLTVAQPGGKQ